MLRLHVVVQWNDLPYRDSSNSCFVLSKSIIALPARTKVNCCEMWTSTSGASSWGRWGRGGWGTARFAKEREKKLIIISSSSSSLDERRDELRGKKPPVPPLTCFFFAKWATSDGAIFKFSRQNLKNGAKFMKKRRQNFEMHFCHKPMRESFWSQTVAA